MDQRKEQLRDVLTSRRARITPQQAGLPAYGGAARRVPGLRRSELAMLADVSVEYLTKLERGNANGVSDSVLGSLARALQLDEAETSHLFDLARGARTAAGARRRPARQQVRPGVRQLLDAMRDVPAFVQNGRLDVIEANALARALCSDLFQSADSGSVGGRLPNHARFTFLDPRSVDFYPTGTAPPETLSRCFGPRQAAIRTTAFSTNSSASSPRAANGSALCGRRITSAGTPRAPRRSGTPSSASSPWNTRHWNSPPMPVRRSSPSPPRRTRRPMRRCSSSRAGPPLSAQPPIASPRLHPAPMCAP